MAIASRNAVRFGLSSSEEAATSVEDRRELKRLRKQIRRDLAARGIVGDALTEILAGTLWRMARLDRAERKAFEALDGRFPAHDVAALAVIARYRAQCSRELLALLGELRADQRTRDPMTLRPASDALRRGARRGG